MSEMLYDRVPVSYLERVVNGMLPGLQMYARDANLTPEQASWYVPGSIICERAFTDATSRFMGMVTTHRITILSNHMVDVSQSVDDPEASQWSLCVAQARSHFKVMDVFEHHGKTQILLLHLPNDENWHIFEQVVLNMEEDLVSTSRERFAAKCEAEVVDVLATRRWLERTSWPIGFLEDGTPQPLDTPLSERMRPLGEAGFREVDGHVVLFAGLSARLSEQGVRAHFAEGYPDLLAYGYVEPNAGLCVRALTSARVSADGHVEWAHDLDEDTLSLRLGGYEGVPVAQVVDGSLFEFAAQIAETDERFAPGEELAKTRELRFLDGMRHPTSPDDIIATLLTRVEGLSGERVLVRMRGVENGDIYGELLDEPQQELWVHAGDMVPVGLAQTDQGLRAFVLLDDIAVAGNDDLRS